MLLKVRRDQKSGMLSSKIKFVLEARAELAEDEYAAIKKYRLGDTVLYTRGELIDKGSGLLGLASRLAFKAMNISVTVNDLVNGKRVECDDIVEMIAVEEQIVTAAQTFKQVLLSAMHFGGEEVVEL